jgi:D-amino peptidase
MAVVLLLTAAVLAQPRSLKVLLLYDMEGVSRATDARHTDYGYAAEYKLGREALTDDVNAAIAGLKGAGVGEVVVVDGHGSGNSAEPDVIEARLLAPARMISRDAAFDIYMDSYDHSFDAVVAIAMHAGAGNLTGFLSHTYSGAGRDYRVNGVPFNETMILAAGASRLKMPVIMVSGDDQLEKELQRQMPWVQYATVKRAVDRTKAEPFPPDEVKRRIETAARTAIGKFDAARVFETAGPYRFAITFGTQAQASNAQLFSGAEPGPVASSVQVRGNDFEEGYRRSIRLYSLAGIADRLERLDAAIAGAPNAAELRQRMLDWETDRFLYRPLPAAPGREPARYWGAR